jgi:uncharacterized membrane protein YciS (DUF1049 family)
MTHIDLMFCLLGFMVGWNLAGQFLLSRRVKRIERTRVLRDELKSGK